MINYNKLWVQLEQYRASEIKVNEAVRQKLISEHIFSDQIWNTVREFTGDNLDQKMNPHWFVRDDGKIECAYLITTSGIKKVWKIVIIDLENNNIYYEE